MKIRLAVSEERWAELSEALTRAGFELDDAELVLLENAIRSEMSAISDRIDRNYQTLITELRAENAMFAKYEYEVAALDRSGRTVLVRVTALPKEAVQSGDGSKPLKKCLF